MPQEEDEYSDVYPSYVFVLCTAAPMTFFIFDAGCARYEQRRFFLLLYIRHRLSIHYSQSKPKASAPSAPSPQPAPRSDVEFRIDLLASQVSTLPSLFLSQLDAPQALFVHYPICSSPRSFGSL